MTKDIGSFLHHRPFATLLRPHTDDATIAASTVRAEIRALVTRAALVRDGADLAARLGLQVLPYRWAVAVSAPVNVTNTAANDRYAAQADIGRLTPGLGRLRADYLTSPAEITTHVDSPRHSLRSVTCRRAEACRGHPVDGIHHLGAVALIAVTVTADTQPAAAHTSLITGLARLAAVEQRPDRMRQLDVHRSAGLAIPPAVLLPAICTEPVVQPQAAPSTHRSRTAVPGNRTA